MATLTDTQKLDQIIVFVNQLHSDTTVLKQKIDGIREMVGELSSSPLQESAVDDNVTETTTEDKKKKKKKVPKTMPKNAQNIFMYYKGKHRENVGKRLEYAFPEKIENQKVQLISNVAAETDPEKKKTLQEELTKVIAKQASFNEYRKKKYELDTALQSEKDPEKLKELQKEYKENMKIKNQCIPQVDISKVLGVEYRKFAQQVYTTRDVAKVVTNKQTKKKETKHEEKKGWFPEYIQGTKTVMPDSQALSEFKKEHTLYVQKRKQELANWVAQPPDEDAQNWLESDEDGIAWLTKYNNKASSQKEENPVDSTFA